MTPKRPTERIGDVERDAQVSALGTHLGAGRLTMTEFEGRLDTVYAARTQAELDEVLADLPPSSPPTREPTRAGVPLAPWAPWALTGVICLLVWVGTSLAHGRPLDFWPAWVIGPWGAVLAVRAGTALTYIRNR